MKKVLSIAGSDCSGGAGIQADLKTFSAHGVFGMTAIASIVAENTYRVIDLQPGSKNALTGCLVFNDLNQRFKALTLDFISMKDNVVNAH